MEINMITILQRVIHSKMLNYCIIISKKKVNILAYEYSLLHVTMITFILDTFTKLHYLI